LEQAAQETNQTGQQPYLCIKAILIQNYALLPTNSLKFLGEYFLCFPPHDPSMTC